MAIQSIVDFVADGLKSPAEAAPQGPAEVVSLDTFRRRKD